MNQKTSLILNAILLMAVIFLFIKVYTCGSNSCCKADANTKNDNDTTKVNNYIPVKNDGQLNIVFIQSDSINAGYKFLLDKKKQLESESKNVEGRLKGEMQKAQKRQKELEGQIKFMSQSEIQAAEQELQKMAMDYQKLEEKLLGDLQEKEAFFQKQLYGNVEEYLAKYAAQRGIDFVFRYERGLNLMFGNKVYDVTSEVLKGLNDEYTSAMSNKNNMHIVQQKLKENIAEYILYMWQIEDIIRAFDLDIEALEFNFIRENVKDEKQVAELRTWYAGLITKMKSQKIEKSGHLVELNEILAELFFLHTTLLHPNGDEAYRKYYEEATPYISEFKERSNSKSLNDVELCLSGLYAKLLLRLKKEKISEETEQAFESFRKMITHLTLQYHKMKRGELNFHYN